MLKPDPKRAFQHSEAALFKIENGAVLILDVHSDESYFRIQGHAVEVWLALAEEKSFEELLELTMHLSRKSRAACSKFLLSFLTDLEAKNLLRPTK